MEGIKLDMKNLFRVIFRDIPSSVLLMVGFGLTIFIAMLGSDLVNNIMNSRESDNNGVYNYYLDMYHTDRVIEDLGDMQALYLEDSAEEFVYEDIYKIMVDNNINFYNQDGVYVGKGQEQQFTATSIISLDKTEPFILSEGYVDWSDKNTVIIGESIKDYTDIIDNKEYLLVNGTYYEVTGVLENNGSFEYDSSIYFINIDQKEKITQSINRGLIDKIDAGLNGSMVVFSKDSDILDKINIVKKQMEEELPLSISVNSEPTRIEDKDNTNFLYENISKVLLPIFMVFCIGSCCSISSLWVKVRKTDIAIRLTYGFSNSKMYRWILKELCTLIGISLLCLLLLRGIYFMIFSDILITKATIGRDMLMISGAVIITLVITSCRAYLYSKLIVPAEVLKEL